MDLRLQELSIGLKIQVGVKRRGRRAGHDNHTAEPPWYVLYMIRLAPDSPAYRQAGG
jgi:hypothetical protein